ncbi:hypothetical protein JFK97_19435 [Chromobacterium phragmitis]|uniref:abortive infection system antitoxin AbiGi family protein n=1 Tax=Chromobacterium amazonense TaxID=1382803 RepID=UPI0021B6F8EA|nr:abortive infection system antitoxin AbiGi family protein [Chromobacterium amazonense]MBM2886568.1 hypothetical protein [Chromobacterium amazonense]MDE1716504.1 abortive infection system antitoxin AbiGi family protein [Chromobacterium amazonense]
MSFRPGTVSKILWHFTGGPLWCEATQKQLKELKPAINGYNALLSILDSKQLRLGQYKEIVKVIVKEKRKYNLSLRKTETIKNYPVTLTSQPVCCVADIPLQHISYHANRYGKIAIGFHRSAVIKAGFNPVMYTLENTELLNKIYEGYSKIDGIDVLSAKSELEHLQGEIDSVLADNDIDESIDSSSVELELDCIESCKESIEASYSHQLAYIKTFDESEFDSIYCEREWRSTKPFNFSKDDIAMIILPREQEGYNFYKKFLDEAKLPREVTVGSWEDLVEH